MMPVICYIYVLLCVFFTPSYIESRITQRDNTVGISVFVSAFNIKSFGVSKMSDPEIANIIKQVCVIQHNLKKISSLQIWFQ
jgi:hypothetical protein